MFSTYGCRSSSSTNDSSTYRYQRASITHTHPCGQHTHSLRPYQDRVRHTRQCSIQRCVQASTFCSLAHTRFSCALLQWHTGRTNHTRCLHTVTTQQHTQYSSSQGTPVSGIHKHPSVGMFSCEQTSCPSLRINPFYHIVCIIAASAAIQAHCHGSRHTPANPSMALGLHAHTCHREPGWFQAVLIAVCAS
jgi:hypothetical protein